MTDIVVAAVQDAGQRAAEQPDAIRLSLADQQCFADAMLLPPKPQPTLKRAMARRIKLLRTDDEQSEWRPVSSGCQRNP